MDQRKFGAPTLSWGGIDHVQLVSVTADKCSLLIYNNIEAVEFMSSAEALLVRAFTKSLTRTHGSSLQN